MTIKGTGNHPLEASFNNKMGFTFEVEVRVKVKNDPPKPSSPNSGASRKLSPIGLTISDGSSLGKASNGP